MKQAEARLAELNVKVNHATWVQQNFITEDTEAISADAQEQMIAATTELVEQAKRFDGLSLPDDLARRFKLLRLSLTAPAPKDPALRREMTQISTSMDGDYGRGRYCRKPDECLDITAIERIMASSRDPKELADLWAGWHKVGAPMRERYSRFVDLSNQGAREIGFKDTGAMWRSALRHESRSVQRGGGTSVATSASAVSFSAHFCAGEAFAALRRDRGSSGWAYPGGFAG